MARILLCWLLALIVFEAPAFAASEPVIAPAPEWVRRPAIPSPNPALADRPLQNLLLSSQSLYGSEYSDHYVEYAVAIQTTQGLQGAGNIVIPWQPDQSDLIVHKAQIIRGGNVIDLLANGQTFTVLRRESNLETAVLDGVLTAVLQPEGLSVGDVVNVAMTIRRRPGSIGLRGENSFYALHGAPVRMLSIRQVWPAGMEMRWRGTGLFEGARVRSTPLGSELLVERRDAEGAEPPANAPARYLQPETLELTAYAAWSEISRAFAPLYAHASELAPASPIRAQVARIAAASPDPRARALAALRLVQDEVRYLALAMGEGHLTPATADQTWTRRYGDCKAKTALLLALLRELGIEAEPVLVNARLGDSVAQRLPQVGAFDHVIVRARIDGTSYWLDGTHTGDRALEDLAGALFTSGLPLRPAGAELESIPLPASRLPTMAMSITYDASHGFAGAVPIRAEVTWHGDAATMMRMGLSQIGREAFLQRLSESSGTVPAGVEITGRELREDDGAGGVTLVMTGTARLTWRRVPGLRVDEFQFGNEAITWNPELERPEGPFHDVPYAFDVPMHFVSTETIILPDQGRGYTIEGGSFERTIAGTRISRDVRIAEGRAVSRLAMQRLQREIPAREMRAAVGPLRAIADDIASVRAPQGTVVQSVSAVASQPGASPRAEATRLVESGYQSLQSGDLDAAFADFDRAAGLAPSWSRPLSNAAIVRIRQNDLDAAGALVERAAALDEDDFVVAQARGLIRLARGEAEPAIAQFTRSLELDPDNVFTLMQRSAALQQAGRTDAALADLDAVMAREPGNWSALAAKTRLLAWQNHLDQALALIDARAAADPANVDYLHLRAEILNRNGRPAEARQAYARALELFERQDESSDDSTVLQHSLLLSRGGQLDRAVAVLGEALEQDPANTALLNGRCWERAISNVELEAALADCEHALALQPRSASYLDSRAMVRLRLGQLDRAIADATAALAINPQLAPSLFVRGVARLRSGDRPGGEADLAAARRIQYDIEAEYREYGVTP